MKSKLFLIALMIFGAWACSTDGDNNDEDQSPSTSSRLTAKVDNVLYESISVFDSIFYGGNQVSGFSISGTNTSQDLILISVSGYNGPDTYDFTSSFGNITFYDKATDDWFRYDSSKENGFGTVVVSSDDGEEIKGTFTFETFGAKDSDRKVTVTEGKFTAEYYNP